MTAAEDEVSYRGVRWRDIDWSLEVHSLGAHCPECRADGAEGHAAGCPYLKANQQTPAGRAFLLRELEEAVWREVEAGLRAPAPAGP